MSEPARRGALVVAGVALAIGAWALVASWGMPVTGPEGVELLERAGPIGPFSPLAAGLTIVLALAALAGAAARTKALVLLSGAGFALAAALALAQSGTETKLLAASGSTFAFLTAAAMGLILLGSTPPEGGREGSRRHERRRSRSDCRRDARSPRTGASIVGQRTP